MKTQFFYSIRGIQHSPVPFENLRQMAVKGDISRNDRVWCRGMKEWQSADSIEGLFQDLPPDLNTEAECSTSPHLRLIEPQTTSMATPRSTTTPVKDKHRDQRSSESGPRTQSEMSPVSVSALARQGSDPLEPAGSSEPEGYYLEFHETRVGPFSLEELSRKAANGTLKPSHLVWAPGHTSPDTAEKILMPEARMRTADFSRKPNAVEKETPEDTESSNRRFEVLPNDGGSSLFTIRSKIVRVGVGVAACTVICGALWTAAPAFKDLLGTGRGRHEAQQRIEEAAAPGLSQASPGDIRKGTADAAQARRYEAEFSAAKVEVKASNAFPGAEDSLLNVLTAAMVATDREKRIQQKVSDGIRPSDEDVQGVAFANQKCAAARAVAEANTR